MMPLYRVTVWAGYVAEIEADSQDEAEELAIHEAPFSYTDYCDTEELITEPGE